MIVSDIMTTKLVTVAPDDLISHSCNLFRRHQFKHLRTNQLVAGAQCYRLLHKVDSKERVF